jgi:hypothetical protein
MIASRIADVPICKDQFTKTVKQRNCFTVFFYTQTAFYTNNNLKYRGPHIYATRKHAGFLKMDALFQIRNRSTGANRCKLHSGKPRSLATSYGQTTNWIQSSKLWNCFQRQRIHTGRRPCGSPSPGQRPEREGEIKIMPAQRANSSPEHQGNADQL